MLNKVYILYVLVSLAVTAVLVSQGNLIAIGTFTLLFLATVIWLLGREAMQWTPERMVDKLAAGHGARRYKTNVNTYKLKGKG